MPPWAQQLAEHQQYIMDQMQAQDQRRQEAIQDRLLDTQKGKFLDGLKEAGIDPSGVFEDPQQLDRWAVANLMTHGMDVGQAVAGIVGFRDGSVKHFTQEVTEPTSESRDLDTSKGVPGGPRPKPGGRQDGYSKARENALADLNQRIRSSAQES
jgi:hypothetical protein